MENIKGGKTMKISEIIDAMLNKPFATLIVCSGISGIVGAFAKIFRKKD